MRSCFNALGVSVWVRWCVGGCVGAGELRGQVVFTSSLFAATADTYTSSNTIAQAMISTTLVASGACQVFAANSGAYAVMYCSSVGACCCVT